MIFGLIFVTLIMRDCFVLRVHLFKVVLILHFYLLGKVNSGAVGQSIQGLVLVKLHLQEFDRFGGCSAGLKCLVGFIFSVIVVKLSQAVLIVENKVHFECNR